MPYAPNTQALTDEGTAMLAEDFIARKRPSWEHLTALLDRTRLSGLAALSAEELLELGQLYRTATSDLAVARRDYASHRVAEYLNGLIARAHGIIYQSRSARRHGLLTFFGETFPRTFRATWRSVLVAFLMFFIPAFVGFVVAERDPAAGVALYPDAEPVVQDIKLGNEWWLSINQEGRSSSAALIMTNNIRVAILAFAGGILLGLLTFYVLVQNGLLLGVIAGAAQAYGFSPNLWGFVAAHGAVELSVIFIAGGAGLQLGWSILRPGLLSRRTALTVAAQRAAHLLLGCIPLLVIAGLIEGFISPSTLPLALKLAISLISGIVLYAYLILVGRPGRRKANHLAQ
jgi:uncharacterized membrane protein SpoIIM required for sporulation